MRESIVVLAAPVCLSPSIADYDAILHVSLEYEG